MFLPDNAASQLETAVFAGGCFWGVEAVFRHIKGVTAAVSGYSGGHEATAQYERVCTGDTGHAEAVQVTFDPSIVSYQQLLEVFFSVIHNPTQLNRQGPDLGSQYRSAIFYTRDEQQIQAQAYIKQLTADGIYSAPIVTQVLPLKEFYSAEAYHQNYLELHPHQPYIVCHDQPKLDALRKMFPSLYQ
jgi:peptide-methionine (S)-S-oxide reductase